MASTASKGGATSLVGSIFGTTTDETQKSSSLSELFSSKRELPERPNNVIPTKTETTGKTKKSVEKGDIVTERLTTTKKKKLNRKNDTEEEKKLSEEVNERNEAEEESSPKNDGQNNDDDDEKEDAVEDGGSSSSSSSDDDSSSSDNSEGGGKEDNTERRKDLDDVSSSSKGKETENAAAAAATAAAPAAPAVETTTKNVETKKDDDEESRTIFVGNLPPSTTRKQLMSMFKPCGKVVSARLRSMAVAGVKLPPQRAGDQNLMRKVCANTSRLDPDTPKKTVQGYVVFQSSDSIDAALRMNNQPLPNNSDSSSLRLRVDTAKPTVDPKRSVFVGNLPYATDESTLASHFVTNATLDVNDVVNVRVVRDRETMQCRGFGYVLLKDVSLVPAALQVHGTVYMRRELRVKVCGKRFKGKRGEQRGPKKKGGVDGADNDASSPGGKRKRMRKDNEEQQQPRSKNKRRRKTASERTAAMMKPGGFQARGEGVSKRAAAEAKLGKRVKKIQKRIGKGMGKSRNRGKK